ncbi:hypothetical protein FRC15_002742 [Serendipita sp. 397]|nr:hypothetical protein FRC15_002742 [Serendipita sp. 397]
MLRPDAQTPDVRDTKVTNQACSTFRTDWGSFTPPPDNLFAPTKANLIMTNISQEIRHSALIAGHTAIEHALLSLQLPSQAIAKPAEITPLADHDRAQKDQRLRINTSGVVVVTPESVVLGNVVEVAGTAEEGTARSQFTVNTASRDVEGFGGRLKFPHMDSSWQHRREAVPEVQRNEKFMLYRSPPTMGAFHSFVERGLAQPPTRTSGSSSQKRRNPGSDSYSVKRFKGSTMKEIFGVAGSSFASRRL